MNNHHIYIVQEFVGCGFTMSRSAHKRQIAEWKNIRAFTEEHKAVKFMESLESLQKKNEPCKYAIEEVSFDIPQETL
jgi:hypothetical protein